MTADRRGLVELVRAHAQGRAAARAGEPLTACPYRFDAPDALTRARARMWFRGYDLERPAAVDYSG